MWFVFIRRIPNACLKHCHHACFRRTCYQAFVHQTAHPYAYMYVPKIIGYGDRRIIIVWMILVVRINIVFKVGYKKLVLYLSFQNGNMLCERDNNFLYYLKFLAIPIFAVSFTRTRTTATTTKIQPWNKESKFNSVSLTRVWWCDARFSIEKPT